MRSDYKRKEHSVELSTPHEPDCWVVSRSRSSCEAQETSDSPGSYAAIQNDAWLPYQRPSRVGDTHWSFEFGQFNQHATPAMDEATSDERRRIEDTCMRAETFASSHPSEHSRPPGKHSTIKNRDEPKRPSSARSPPKMNDGRVRGRRIPPDHPLLENGQLYHPQLHEKRTGSVPNYSRPWTPKTGHTRKRTMSSGPSEANAAASDEDISYERVNGVCLDTKPRTSTEQHRGLSIPEIEARDIVEIDQWLEEPQPEFTSLAPHPAAYPPPIGGKEDRVRAISPQPPSRGQHHAFISHYSWMAEEPVKFATPLLDESMFDTGTGVGEQSLESVPTPAPPPPPPSRRKLNEDTDTPSRTGQARTLLTEAIRDLLNPFRKSS